MFVLDLYHADMLVYQNQVVYDKSFADARIGQPILCINSLYRLGLAINQGSFARPIMWVSVHLGPLK